jgi:hypothetical protein
LTVELKQNLSGADSARDARPGQARNWLPLVQFPDSIFDMLPQ